MRNLNRHLGSAIGRSLEALLVGAALALIIGVFWESSRDSSLLVFGPVFFSIAVGIISFAIYYKGKNLPRFF
jgi:ABC-type transport system involved in cytochrome c biogenesis permease subunit